MGKVSGFTLLELVVTLTLLGLLAGIVAPYLSVAVRAAQQQGAELRELTALRLATERLSRELREIRRNPANPAARDVALPLSNSRIVFVRNDGEQVTVEAAAGRLDMRYASLAGNAAFPLLENLDNFRLSYLQADGVTAATGATDLAYVGFEIRVAANGRTRSQRGLIAMRAGP